MERQEKIRRTLTALFPEATMAAAGVEQAEAAPREPGVVVADFARSGSALDVLCRPDQVVAVAQVMDAEGFFLEAISGVDWIDKHQLEVIYDYTWQEGPSCRVMVRTFVPRTEPVLPTISTVFSAADWHERETFDFYGVQFQGHPNLIRILLPEDADFHPLLKDFVP